MFLFTYCILLRNVTSLQVLILCMFYSKLYMVQVQLHDYRAVARLIDSVADGTPFEVAHAFGG